MASIDICHQWPQSIFAIDCIDWYWYLPSMLFIIDGIDQFRISIGLSQSILSPIVTCSLDTTLEYIYVTCPPDTLPGICSHPGHLTPEYVVPGQVTLEWSVPRTSYTWVEYLAGTGYYYGGQVTWTGWLLTLVNTVTQISWIDRCHQ